MTTETQFEQVSVSGISVVECDSQTAVDILTDMREATVKRLDRAALQFAINTIRLQRAQIERMTHGGR